MSSQNIFFQLFKNIFEIFQKENASSLTILTDEHFLIELLRQIEPNIEKYGKAFDITKDEDFGIRYSNFLNIIEVIEAYKDKSSSKDSFKENCNFRGWSHRWLYTLGPFRKR